MGYAIKRGTHRIPLAEFDGSDNWVEIHAGRSYGQRVALSAQALSLRIEGEETKTDFDLAENRLGLLESSIVSWSLRAEDEDPEPMPICRQTFQNELDGPVGDFIAEQITSYYEGTKLDPKAASSSNANSTEPSPPKQPSRPRSR